MVNVRDAFYEVLRATGFQTIFGNPGSNELPLLSDLPTDFRYIHALQEGAAIGMADGYALATGRPSLVNLHAAAGTGNAMGNLTNTQSGHVPVVVTSGQQARRYTALNAMLTNVDATTLPKPLVKWSNEPLRPKTSPKRSRRHPARGGRPGRAGVPLAAAGRLGPRADLGALAHLTVRAVHGDPVRPRSSRGVAAEQTGRGLEPPHDPRARHRRHRRLGRCHPARRESRAARTHRAQPVALPVPDPSPELRGILPSDVPGVASALDGHDVVVAFGAAIFRYHVFAEGDYLPAGPNSGPSRRTRTKRPAPPSVASCRQPVRRPDAARRQTLPSIGRRRSRPSLGPTARQTGPGFSAEAILDALDAAKDENTVIAQRVDLG